jgi:Ca2+-binding RTX toxin-like protein
VLLGGPGADFLAGGAGFDTAQAAGDGTFVLWATWLSVAGVRDSLTGVERAELSGGPGDDTFDVSGWLGQAALDGGGGHDRVALRRGGNVTLSYGRLATSARNFWTLANIEAATLTGGPGADRFTVSGWTGSADVNGGGGTDTIVSSNDADFTLTDRLLTRSTGGTFRLASIERAILQGGAGNNTLDASGFTRGAVVLVGLAGDDRLVGGAGRDLLIGGLGADVLLGNGGDDVLIAGFTAHDGNVAALDLLMQEWSRADLGYAARRDHLRGVRPAGKNGRVRLNASTVHGDSVTDTLTGGLGVDWFFALAPELTDRNGRAETLTPTS